VLILSILERWRMHKPLPPDIQKRLKNLAPLFEQNGVLLAYLFGSLNANGGKSSRPPGDLDLAILTKERPAFELEKAIIDIIGTDRLDLVDLRRAPPVMRFEILRTGFPIYVADEDLRLRYELDTLNAYRDTAPMRRRQWSYLKERTAAWCSEEN
jgi:uncharacterized protein